MKYKTPDLQTMTLLDLHSAAVARWKEVPALGMHIGAWLYCKTADGQEVPYLGHIFLKWAITCPVDDVIAYVNRTN